MFLLRNKNLLSLLSKNICCDPSLEPSHRNGSNEGSQHMFLLRNLKNYLCIIPVPYLAGAPFFWFISFI